MRLWESRFTRDVRRLALIRRLIGHEARTETIASLTGMSARQIHRFYKNNAEQRGWTARRPRGFAPRSVDYFFSSLSRQDEAAAMASWCVSMGVIRPGEPAARLSAENDIQQVDDLCLAFELFRALLPKSYQPQLSFDHLVLLRNSLSRDGELRLESCEHCSADMIVERSVLRPHVCTSCKSRVSQTVAECRAQNP